MSTPGPGALIVEAHAHRLERRHLAGLRELFQRASCPCHCRYWHFDGTKNDWLMRCATSPDDNADAFDADFERGDDAAQGVVVVAGEDVVGWLKLAPRAAVPKLRQLPVYRNLPLGDDADVWSIGCMLVDPARRGRGVARLLVAAAARLSRAAGKILEAYPTRSAPGPEDAWRGPHELFVELGFTPFEPNGAQDDPLGLGAPTHAYPVLRLPPNGVQRPPPLG